MSSTMQSWVRANCPVPAVHDDLFGQAQLAESQGRDYHILLGAKLTKQGTAYLVYHQSGELFVFSLTRQQAEIEDALGAVMQFTLEAPRQTAGASPAVYIDTMEINLHTNLSIASPITGHCTYRLNTLFTEMPCLRLSMLLRSADAQQGTQHISMFHYPSSLNRQGTLDFKYDPLVRENETPWPAQQQIVAAFLAFCSISDPSHGNASLPLSNSASVLLNFV